MPYMPQMDGLRAIAVSGVLVQHWFATKIPFGTWGVLLFFVISGYLITHAIFRLKEANVSTVFAAKIFFVRRTARLAPPYLLILFIWLGVSKQFRSDWAWYFLYGSNFLLNIRQEWIALTPTWSLAVEEQFYLAWFFFIILTRRRLVVPAMLLLIVASPTIRAIYALQGNAFGAYLPWSNLDALVLGALLATLELRGWSPPKHANYAIPVVGTVAILYSTLEIAHSPAGSALIPFSIAVASSLLVWQSRIGFRGFTGYVLGNSALVHLGRISYGIYLYHILTLALASNIEMAKIPVVSILFKAGSIQGFVVLTILTYSLAALSFKYYENPTKAWVSAKWAK